MNSDDRKLVLAAGENAGLKLHEIKWSSGKIGVLWMYCKSGQTASFNPFVSLHDAMIIALECCEGATWDGDFFTIYPKGDTTDKAMKLGRIKGVNRTQMIRNVGTAILKAATHENT